MVSAIVATFAVAGADEAIWFSGPAFCEGICLSSPPGADPVPLNRSIIPSIKAYDPVPDDNIGSFDLSPDGKIIAFMRVHRPYAYHDVWVMDSDGNNPREVFAQGRQGCEYNTQGKRVCSSNTPRFGHGIQWSPNGSEILFTSYGGLRLVDLNGMVGVLRTGTAADDMGHMHWSSMGIVYSGYTESEDEEFETFIAIVDRNGNAIERFDFGEDLWGFNPTLSPDASKLSFSYWDSLYVYDITNETLWGIETGAHYYTHHAWSPDGQKIVYYEWLDWEGPGFLKSIDVGGTNQTVLLEFPSPDPVRNLNMPFIADIDWIPESPLIPTGITPATWGQVKASVSNDRSPE